MEVGNNWYVFYTKSRSEKAALDQLCKQGISAYLPLVKELRQWSDRKKTVEVPLFRSYVFVECAEHEIPELLQWHPKLVTYVRYNGKPAIIRVEELQQIEKYIHTGYHVSVEPDDDLTTGDIAKILDGPLRNTEGEVLTVKNRHYLVMRIQALNQHLKVELPKQILMKVKTVSSKQ